ncbi:MAG: DUF2726 domain-containing protein [Gammaproteobacteria bacterium]|nr:DUF2726 domain-containing protein [Gammaproteobacteria bacterium]
MSLTTLVVVLAILVIVAVGAVAAVLVSRGSRAAVGEYPYMKREFLLSKAELSFMGVLKQSVGDAAEIYSKVRVADVLAPTRGLERGAWQRAFNQISAKHFDFLICDRVTSKVFIAVELDDASHNEAKAKRRDQLLAGACKAAELPLLRVTAARGYAVAELRTRLAELGLSNDSVPDHATPERISPTAPAAAELAESTPVCPKCGAATVLRTARSGKHAGKQFWGCSTYPKCRGAVPADRLTQRSNDALTAI